MLPETIRNKLNYARQVFLQDYLPEVRPHFFTAEEWAEPGNTDPSECEETGLSGLIVFADWNDTCSICGRLHMGDEKHEFRGDLTWALDRALKALTDDEKKLLEEELGEDRVEHWLNIDPQWSDTNGICIACGRAVETEPSYCGWTPYYKEGDELGKVCHDCLLDEEKFDRAHLLRLIVNQLADCRPIDPEELGFIEVPNPYGGMWSCGWYEHSDDDPEAQLKRLNGFEYDVMFKLYPEQFQIKWELFVKLRGEEDFGGVEARNEGYEESVVDDVQELIRTCGKCRMSPTPAQQMRAAMEEANRQSAELKKEQAEKGGVIHSTLKPDGTAETRLVSQEEFIRGGAR